MIQYNYLCLKDNPRKFTEKLPFLRKKREYFKLFCNNHLERSNALVWVHVGHNWDEIPPLALLALIFFEMSQLSIHSKVVPYYH